MIVDGFMRPKVVVKIKMKNEWAGTMEFKAIVSKIVFYSNGCIQRKKIYADKKNN